LVYVSSQIRKPGVHIAWKTVTYRSVALLIVGAALVCLLAIRLAFPEFTESSIKAVDGIANRMLERVAGMGPAQGGGVSTAQQAHFTALDGTVRIKRLPVVVGYRRITTSLWRRATWCRPARKAWRR
jgi:hypothetical protein